MIGLKPNPNWLTLRFFFFGVPGPFTADLTQFSSTLIGYFIEKIKGGQMLLGIHEYTPLLTSMLYALYLKPNKSLNKVGA